MHAIAPCSLHSSSCAPVKSSLGFRLPDSDPDSHGLTCVTSRDGSTHAVSSVCINSRTMHFQASSSSLSSGSYKSNMTSRALFIPGTIFLLAATILLIITSISLPYLPAIDFVRTHVESGNIGVTNSDGTITSSSVSQLKVSYLVFGVLLQPLMGVVCTVRIVVLLHHRITFWKS